VSKKKFTIGLESLFGMATEEAFQEESPLLDKTKKEVKKVASSIKKRSSKNFTSDLDTLFKQALSDTIEESEEKAKSSKQAQAPPQRRQRRLRRLSGLDALIRHTEDMEVVEVNVPTKKRVTFVVEKEKLAKLKDIAKEENAYLKDIINRVVSNFIDKYEKEQN
jgi:hypothetical protein